MDEGEGDVVFAAGGEGISEEFFLDEGECGRGGGGEDGAEFFVPEA